MEIRQLTNIILIMFCTLPFVAQGDVIKLANNAAQVVKRIDTPRRGINQAEVLRRFGEPRSKQAAVGKPPISSWSYASYDVYFEGDLVLHTVVKPQ